MTKIKITDSVRDIMVKMSEGNPGALTVLTLLIKEDEMNLVTRILALDTMNLYGCKLYMLWNDCCDRDLEKVKDIIDAWQRGKLALKVIHDAVSGGRGTPIEICKERKR